MPHSRDSLFLQESLVSLIIEKHKVAGNNGLSLFIGEDMDETKRVRPEEYSLSLADVKVIGGSRNDAVLQVLTYDYAPHRTADAGSIPPSRNYGILHVPRGVALAPLRQSIGPC